MYFRLSKKNVGDKTYTSTQLVHTIRHPISRKPTTRVLATLGDLSGLDEAKRLALVASLSRALGMADLVGGPGQGLAPADLEGATAKARSAGSMWAILEVLRQLHVPQTFGALVADRGNAASLCRHLNALLCHRLDDPGSKLSLLNWLDTVLIPGLDGAEVTYQGLLRTMDALLANKDGLERALARRVLTLFDEKLDLVLMDVTSVSVCSVTDREEGLFERGYSRDGHPERKQYVLLLVTTKDGVPVYHEVHPGDSADAGLLSDAMTRAKRLFPVDRCMVVADRGMLSEKNLTALASLGFRHLVAMPLKREAGTRRTVEKTHRELWEKALGALEAGEGEAPEALAEAGDECGRVIVALNMDMAFRQREDRGRKLAALGDRVVRIGAQRAGDAPVRGRPLSGAGAFKALFREALDKKLTAYLRMDLTEGGELVVEPVEEAVAYAEKCDGKLAIHTDDETLRPEEIYRIYKDLQEIERSFRSLKSVIRIRPTFHWTERRVRAHAFLCVLALLVERVVRLKLRAAGVARSPHAALKELGRLTHVRIDLPGRPEPVHVLANQDPVQLALFKALEVEPLTRIRLQSLAV